LDKPISWAVVDEKDRETFRSLARAAIAEVLKDWPEIERIKLG
jgi:DNA-binding protein YbaB